MEQIPDYIYAEAWRILYNAFGERMQQEELDLMDAVLAGVIAEEEDRAKIQSAPLSRLSQESPGSFH